MYVSQGRLGMDTHLLFCRRLIEGVEICLTHIQSNLGWAEYFKTIQIITYFTSWHLSYDNLTGRLELRDNIISVFGFIIYLLMLNIMSLGRAFQAQMLLCYDIVRMHFHKHQFEDLHNSNYPIRKFYLFCRTSYC